MQRLYCVYDCRAHVYGVPYTSVADDVAERTVACTMLSVPDTHLMYAYADDYELVYLGGVDDRGYLVQDQDCPKTLSRVSDIIAHYDVAQKRRMMQDAVQMQDAVPANSAE